MKKGELTYCEDYSVIMDMWNKEIDELQNFFRVYRLRPNYLPTGPVRFRLGREVIHVNEKDVRNFLVSNLRFVKKHKTQGVAIPYLVRLRLLKKTILKEGITMKLTKIKK